MGIAKKAARKLKRALNTSQKPAASGPSPQKPSPHGPEQVIVKQLVLPKADLGHGPGEHAISELDRTSLFGRYALPALERMSVDDHLQFTDKLLSLQRMRALKIDRDRLEFPEAQCKLVRNTVQRNLTLPTDAPRVVFDGSKASELSAFMLENRESVIDVASPEIALDATIAIPSGTQMRGNGAKIIDAGTDIEKAILLDKAESCSVTGFTLEACSRYGIFVKQSKSFSIEDNKLSNLPYKGIVVMGACDTFRICNNQLNDMGNGGIFLNGDIHTGLIEGNVITRNGGTGNLSGGIVLASMKTDDYDTAFVPWQIWNLVELTECPHNIVVANNRVTLSRSNGMYSHAGYCNYFIANTLEENNKEGMCLDFGSCGCYVAYNVFKGNGGRLRMTQRELEEDFIAHAGLLEDGSSPLKVPGLSLDNAAYNIIYQNIVAESYGSGIKMVRSGLRNVILCNEVTDNNVGQSDRGHFFGIELASDLKPDYEADEVQELDFTPCFENIIARNTISGAHHSGVFLGVDAYINDVFDNTIMGSPLPIELITSKHNSQVNNRLVPAIR